MARAVFPHVVCLRPKYGGGDGDNRDLLQKFPCVHCCTQCPQPYSRLLQTHASTRDSCTLTGKSGSVSCGVTPPFSWILVHTHKVLFVSSKNLFPQLCVSSKLYGGINGNLLQKGLCHTQVYCTQSPCPCSSPRLTLTSTGDTQTQFRLSLCGVSGFWYTQGLFEPSEHLWQVWGLILNVISPLLPSHWGFSFALGHGVSLLVEFNILLSTAVQQCVLILEFS